MFNEFWELVALHAGALRSANWGTVLTRIIEDAGEQLADIDIDPAVLDRVSRSRTLATTERESEADYYSVFISYSHDDRVFAERLYNALQSRGIRAWLDKHWMLPGDDIYEQVDRGIRLWDKVLLCCSEASLTSWWVDNEIDRAFEKERELMKQRERKVLSLIPLNLDGYLFDGWEHEYKDYLTERLAADFTGWETDNAKFEREFERVVKAMMTEGAKPPPPEGRL